MTMLMSPAVSAFGANPFLDALDDKPVSGKFEGSQWGDDIEEEEIPLTMQVVTTRVSKMAWGAIFKIEFSDVTSRARNPAGVRPKLREIRPDYFVVTDDRIVLLNEEDNDTAVKKISALDKPPQFEQSEIYGITSGKFDYEEGLWKTTIRLRTISACMMRITRRVTSKKSFGKRALDWLNTQAATARTRTVIDSNGKRQLKSSKLMPALYPI